MATTKKLLTPDEVRELNETLQDFQHDESEQGRREWARVKSKLRRLVHDETCQVCAALPEGERFVQWDVPLDTCKKKFRINTTEYFGLVRVPACESQVLANMVDENRREALRHNESSGSTVFLGQISARARAVQE